MGPQNLSACIHVLAIHKGLVYNDNWKSFELTLHGHKRTILEQMSLDGRKKLTPKRKKAKVSEGKREGETATTVSIREKMDVGQVTFGRALRDEAFLLDPKSIHINQGSWGCCPKPVFDAQTKIKARIEFQPDHHFRHCNEKEWFSSLHVVCQFLHLKPENTSFVDNTTTGINAVMKSVSLKPGDQILLYSWTFPANVNIAHHMAESTGAEVLTLELRYPVESKEDVLEKYRNMLKRHPNIKIAILDYISSPTATLFPIREIVQLCKEHDVMSLVDGAHTLGHIEPMVEDIVPDFFIGNLHKWLFCPRPSAVLWVNPKHHNIIRPLMVSLNYKQSPWQKVFFEQATRDYSAHLTSPDGIRFYTGLGGIAPFPCIKHFNKESISRYTAKMLDKAVKLLVEKWGTRKFDIPRDMEAPLMRLIRLPNSHYHTPSGSTQAVYGINEKMMFDLSNRFHIYAAVLVIQDEPWIRISGSVYNYLEEYQILGEAVLSLISEHHKSA